MNDKKPEYRVLINAISKDGITLMQDLSTLPLTLKKMSMHKGPIFTSGKNPTDFEGGLLRLEVALVFIGKTRKEISRQINSLATKLVRELEQNRQEPLYSYGVILQRLSTHIQ